MTLKPDVRLQFWSQLRCYIPKVAVAVHSSAAQYEYLYSTLGMGVLCGVSAFPAFWAYSSTLRYWVGWALEVLVYTAEVLGVLAAYLRLLVAFTVNRFTLTCMYARALPAGSISPIAQT